MDGNQTKELRFKVSFFFFMFSSSSFFLAAMNYIKLDDDDEDVFTFFCKLLMGLEQQPQCNSVSRL